MWPWYQEALKNAFEENGNNAYEFSWFKLFWIREKSNLRHRSFYHKIQYRLLFGPLVFKVNLNFYRKVKKLKPDVIFLYSTTLLYNYTLKKIKKDFNHVKLCQYNNDSPFSNKVTAGLWRLYKSNIKLCDYHFIFRESDRKYYQKFGAQNISLLMPYFIPKKDFNIPIGKIPNKFISDIVFAGHYENDGRLDLLENLYNKGYKLKLFGGGWNKVLEKKNSPLKKLMPISPVTGLDYNYAICGSKIVLCFLSKINNDKYTRRNFEVPAMGKLMLSEYSSELSKLFKEDEEMVFFKNKNEFYIKVDYLLKNDLKRIQIETNLKNFTQKGHSVNDRANLIIKAIDL